MSSDEYTETTSTSWFSRIGNSLKGILVGIVLILVSIFVLFWNEGRSVKEYKTLKEGAGAVIPVSADKVEAGNAGKLVHMTGQALTDQVLRDDDFGVAESAIKLKRAVEMYQWEEESKSETKKKLGGGEETKTTYSYEKKWSEDLIDSGKFKKAEGHDNPASMPYESKIWSASHVSLGAFALSEGLINMMSSFEELPIKKGAVGSEESSDPDRPETKISQGRYYLGEDPDKPKVGDLRVSYSVVKPSTVSIIAKQLGSSFEPYITKAGGSIEMLQPGTASADAMFADAQASSAMLTWILRFVGIVLMFVGFSMILKPLSVLGDVLPILGSLISVGTGFVSLCLSLIISLITIAVAWLFFRPLLGVLLLILAGGGIYLLKRKASQAAPG